MNRFRDVTNLVPGKLYELTATSKRIYLTKDDCKRDAWNFHSIIYPGALFLVLSVSLANVSNVGYVEILTCEEEPCTGWVWTRMHALCWLSWNGELND